MFFLKYVHAYTRRSINSLMIGFTYSVIKEFRGKVKNRNEMKINNKTTISSHIVFQYGNSDWKSDLLEMFVTTQRTKLYFVENE